MIKNLVVRAFRFVDARMRFYKDRKKYTVENEDARFKYIMKNENRQYYDRYATAGLVDCHYFLQDIYVASKIIKRAPIKHYDVGSRLDGFVSHLLASDINVFLIDIRPLPFVINNLDFIEGNASDLRVIPDESIESLSSLHAVEHFGLGRYGDPVEPMAWKKALLEFIRVLKKDGVLYLSVPIGPTNMVCYNAHRIFEPKTIVETMEGMSLLEFSYIKDMKLYTDTDYKDYKEEENYLCGIFVFKKG